MLRLSVIYNIHGSNSNKVSLLVTSSFLKCNLPTLSRHEHNGIVMDSLDSAVPFLCDLETFISSKGLLSFAININIFR